MNKPTARYIIVLDRYDPGDDYAASEVGESGHDGTAEAGCRQVANELQEAMNQTGCPAGFFNVIDRLKIEPTETVSGASAAQVAMQLGWTRRMEGDECPRCGGSMADGECSEPGCDYPETQLTAEQERERRENW